MSFRAATVYIESRTRRRLSMLSRILPSETTPDALADEMLNHAMKERYPQLLEMEREIDDVEKRFGSRLIQEMEK